MQHGYSKANTISVPGKSPLGNAIAKVCPDGMLGISTPLKVGFGNAALSLSQSMRFLSKVNVVSNSSSEKDTAIGSSRDVAYPKATAICGRNRSTRAQTRSNLVCQFLMQHGYSKANTIFVPGKSPLGNAIAKVCPDGMLGISTPLKVGFGNAALSLSQSMRFLARVNFDLREPSILIDRSAPKSGTNNISSENDRAFKSEKDGANPKATAMCGRKSSTKV
jgi:hypothetical protein